MRLRDDLRKCVAFIGVGDEKTFEAFGTGFFIQYKKVIYFVTARHIAEPFGDSPMTIRMNSKDGGTFHKGYDGAIHGEMAPWFFSADDTVDIAIVQAGNWRPEGADMLALPESCLVRGDQFPDEGIGIGDFCYAIGLFRLMSGKKRMLPFVHTGHVGMLPGDERIPLENWREGPGQPASILVEGYLVEISALEGLSGSPVFVRVSMNITDIPHKDGSTYSLNVPMNKLYLLGVWQSSWQGDPNAVLQSMIGEGWKVPVGIGVVAPTSKLLDLLESEPVASARTKFLEKLEAQEAAKTD